MDKHKDNGIILEPQDSLKYAKGVIALAENDPELLNSVYREISERLGMDNTFYYGLMQYPHDLPMRIFSNFPASVSFARMRLAVADDTSNSSRTSAFAMVSFS